MAKYTITGYCFTHAGELTETATSEKDAMAKAESMKKTVLQKLRVPRDGSAIVMVYQGSQNLLRDRVVWP